MTSNREKVIINGKQIIEIISDISSSRDIKQGTGLEEITEKRQDTRVRKSLSKN